MSRHVPHKSFRQPSQPSRGRMECVDFANLPPHVLAGTFDRVAKETTGEEQRAAITAIRETCRNWCEVFNNELGAFKPFRLGNVHTLVHYAATKFPKLTELDLSDCVVVNRKDYEAIKHIKMPGLQSLVLPTNSVGFCRDNYLTCFGNLMAPGLTALVFGTRSFYDRFVPYSVQAECLGILPSSLVHFDMQGVSNLELWVGSEGLHPHISHLTNLRHLSLTVCSDDLPSLRNALEWMSTMTGLTHLGFRRKIESFFARGPGNWVDPSTIAGLAALTGLASLDLSYIVDAQNWECFEGLTRLTHLRLKHCGVFGMRDGKVLPTAKCMPLLEHLNLSHCTMTSETLMDLAQFRCLTTLCMNPYWPFHNSPFDTEFLKALTRLQHLDLGYIPLLIGDGFQSLTGLKYLKLHSIENARKMVLMLPNPLSLEYLELMGDYEITAPLKSWSMDDRRIFFEKLSRSIFEAVQWTKPFQAWSSESDDSEFVCGSSADDGYTTDDLEFDEYVDFIDKEEMEAIAQGGAASSFCIKCELD